MPPSYKVYIWENDKNNVIWDKVFKSGVSRFFEIGHSHLSKKLLLKYLVH